MIASQIQRNHTDDSEVAACIVGELTGIDLERDGSRFRISFNCRNGEGGSLSLPTETLHSLIMTLPRLMAQTLKAKYRDESLRLVYPAERIRIEQSSDSKIFIVTMKTPDGFEVSFGLNEKQMKSFDEAIDERNMAKIICN